MIPCFLAIEMAFKASAGDSQVDTWNLQIISMRPCAVLNGKSFLFHTALETSNRQNADENMEVSEWRTSRIVSEPSSRRNRALRTLASTTISATVSIFPYALCTRSLWRSRQPIHDPVELLEELFLVLLADALLNHGSEIAAPVFWNFFHSFFYFFRDSYRDNLHDDSLQHVKQSVKHPMGASSCATRWPVRRRRPRGRASPR